MLIGYDGRFIKDVKTGDGIYAQSLLESLSRVESANEYRVYLTDRLPIEQLELDTKVGYKVMSRLHRFAWTRVLFTYPLELHRHPVDLFHAHYTIPARCRIPVVLTVHDFSWIVHPELYPLSVRLPRTYTAMYSIQRADKIITGSAFIKKEILQHFDIDEDRVIVIPYGLDMRIRDTAGIEDTKGVMEKYRISGKYILAVGNIHPRKNLVRLIEAFKILKSTAGIPHQMVLIGKSFWQQASVLAKQVHAVDLSNEVVLTGYVPNNELRLLYRRASLFIYPSLYEGFGFPILEAMVHGVPVVASDNTSAPEVGGDAAMYFNPFDVEDMAETMRRVLDDEGLRKWMIQAGIQRAGRFDWKRTAEETLKVYQSFR